MDSKERLEKMKNQLKKIEFLKVLIPIIGILIANLQLLKVVKITKHVTFTSIIGGIIVNAVIIYLCIIIYKQRKETQNMKESINILEEKNECLKEINDSLRCFKHDFANIIQAIDGYIMIGNMQALKKYFSKFLEEFDQVKNLELLTTNAISNPAIYGVILNKYRLAKKKNVQMNIEVLMDFKDIGEESYKLSRILGILLDNAIEASVDCKNKYINIQFTQNNVEKVKKIIIENTYNNKEIDTDIIFEKDFSTKKARGNSGLGLWKVRDLLSAESKICLQTTKNANLFKQELGIYV